MRRFDSGVFSVPFERFKRDDISDWASGFTLLDTMETYFDSRLDLLQRSLAKHSDRLKLRAEETLNEVLKKDVFKEGVFKIVPTSSNQIEKEMQRFKLKVSQRVISITETWHSTKVVRTREKVTFFMAVMSLFMTALLLGVAPEWIHVAYTLQAAYYLPMRVYKYKKRSWHYFLFDLCYYCNVLNLIYIWVMPSNPAFYVIVHSYLSPLSFTVIRHYYPNAEDRFPALSELPYLYPIHALILSGIIYLIWQLLYWKFVLINRRAKVQSGQRATSFTYLLNDKRGIIGRALSTVPAESREIAFMFGQLVYSILTELPAVFLLYDSSFWSSVFLLFIFAVSVWNGGGFYIEVFGRKFERELEALRKELADARSERSSPTLGPQSDDDLATVTGSPDIATKTLSPIVSTMTLENTPAITSKTPQPQTQTQ
ncbi:hypothetical protein A0H81_03679 [Grifola frondosa]|uniref:Glycerophosphocholine acyltransferase 1 n=1 Tax=Grifola frondosa TaxID=5627 RepID=A0A1C7MK03_GRIFR|nr:hypothetical protein A0H81_03679 [Grifola frondosa]